jgi:hypothetical protein
MSTYTITIASPDDPGTVAAFIKDAREAGVIAAYEDGSGTRLQVWDTGPASRVIGYDELQARLGELDIFKPGLSYQETAELILGTRS